MEIGLIFLLIVIGIAVRLLAGSFDTDRIDEAIKSRGGELISKEWSPLGKGWFGDRSDRIYKVTYFDSTGNKREAFVKTSMFSGVYFSEDKVIENDGQSETKLAASNEANSSLKLENEQLKAELEKLKKQLPNKEN